MRQKALILAKNCGWDVLKEVSSTWHQDVIYLAPKCHLLGTIEPLEVLQLPVITKENENVLKLEALEALEKPAHVCDVAGLVRGKNTNHPADRRAGSIDISGRRKVFERIRAFMNGKLESLRS